ncbi:MAG: calcineurin-like phosphoesterase C-terminal domain-containing protein [Hyphomicrobium sp.]
MSDHQDFRPSRRAALTAIGAGAATVMGSAGVLAAARASGFQRAQGVVFEDRSFSGVRRRSDRGVAGVMVSNGCDVAVTDAEGRWSLPVAPGDHVFVVKPSGWTSGPNRGVPRFSYRCPASAPPPSSIEFPLLRQREPSRFEALLFADTQAANPIELEYVRRDLMRCAHGSGAAFALHHGDAMGDDLSLLARYRRILEDTGLTWHHCPGNHDLDLDAADPAKGFETWTREIGPTHYAFEHGGALFFLLNNVDYLGRDAATPDGRRYRGRIGARQLRFVDNVLRHTPEHRLVVVSMHIPLVSFDAPESRADTTADRAALLRLLVRRPHTISFAGHSHTTEHHDLGPEYGFDRGAPHRHHVLTAASGSWWSGPPDADGAPTAVSRDGSPRGYHVLSVDGHCATTRFHPLTAEASPQLRVMLRTNDPRERAPGAPLRRAALSDAELVVNAFDGGPATHVTFEFPGLSPSPQAMTRTSAHDPHVVESYDRHRALCKPWVAAAPSSHLWTSPLPRDLSIGVHEAIIRVTGEFGRESSTRATIEIAA